MKIQSESEDLMVSETFGYTKTDVVVTQVIKGDDSLLNTTIKIREPYYPFEIDGVKGYISGDNYEPAIVGNEYVLFLGKYSGDMELYKDAYSVKYCERGKYLVNDTLLNSRSNTNMVIENMTNEELNVGPYNSDFYKDIYKDVVKKYILK